MAKVKTISEPKHFETCPAFTAEARQQQLIALATDLAEQQLLNGTASSQVIVHYLKLGTEKERRETERLEEEVKLLKAKTEALESSKRVEELYSAALKAMRTYSGQDQEDDY